MLGSSSYEDQQRTKHHGSDDCLADKELEARQGRRTREIKQERCETPTEDRERMPASPNNSNMFFV